MALFDFNALPGLGTAAETAEKMILWGRHEQAYFRSGILASTSTDNGNTPTTTVRTGMILAQVSNKWQPYKSTASDGTQLAQGLLASDVKLTDPYGTLSDHVCVVIVAGPVKASQLLYNAPVQASTTLTGIDPQARAQLNDHMVFDDQLYSNTNPWINVIPKTASYTVKVADSGTEFTNTGAAGTITFTLPALLDANSNPVCKGVLYRFTTIAAQAIAVARAGSDTVVFYNDAAHGTATTTTKVGLTLEVRTDDTGTRWVFTLVSGVVGTDVTMS